MEISAQVVKELRARTGAGMMDCKKALLESGGDMDKAIEYLRVKGIARAQKKSERETTEGLIVSYIHPGNRIGVLLEVNCETDFVARTEEFQTFAKDIAMQIAAAAPQAIQREDLDQEVVEKERELLRIQAIEEKKPEKVIDKIVEGRMEKFYSEACLLDQIYIKDNDKKVKGLLDEIIGKIGENIRIARFARFQLGR
ncbi:MAG: translation elongation factor Ts [Candidatus Latescibacteria bacterium]|nr:translation elongation factor Ts [Candidatus Latescibacterota bacterium]NIM22145.1 translation elongation factor Ts [Candidatus Latescibacterota bacterium]NIM64695.1 translation elongation factor Ts [Candidatus Latescibacterota bacterium]NIO01205.1 translation elongation factor Ts [Candidatus Latescibacterota bacterium]NIO27590.1 translation elongation factor Ts [Candidatus Latescibacterota bacterium]